jgi:hypothetical protein
MKVFLLTLGALCAIPTAPLHAQSPAPAKPEIQQGLAVTFSAGGKTDTRPARLVALFVPAGQPVSPFLAPGPFTARWEADIVAELRAEYTFSVETSGTATVTINGAQILDSRL